MALQELIYRKVELPEIIPDVIPEERKPSGPMEEPDIEYEDDEVV